MKIMNNANKQWKVVDTGYCDIMRSCGTMAICQLGNVRDAVRKPVMHMVKNTIIRDISERCGINEIS